MRYPGFAVVAGWTLFNAVLVIVLIAYQGHPFAIALYAATVVFLLPAALAVLISCRRGPREQIRYRLPSGTGAAVLPTAAAAVVIGLAFVYGLWLLSIAALLLILALILAVQRSGTKRRSP